MTDPLAARLAADPEAGFVELVRTYSSTVLTLLRRNGVDGPTAEDLTQDTFTRAWRGLAGYESSIVADLRLRPWLLTIALNVLRNHWRTSGRRPRTGPWPEGDSIEAAISSDPAEFAVRSAGPDGDHLAALLEALPDIQRQAIVLRHVLGLPTGEIAELLGCPPGTAKSHVSRGLTALRRELVEARAARAGPPLTPSRSPTSGRQKRAVRSLPSPATRGDATS